MSMRDAVQLAIETRALLRSAPRASLATLTEDGGPYVSLVLTADDGTGTPLLLLSDLAEHAKNLKRDARASLLVEAAGTGGDPLAAPRATLLGKAECAGDDSAAKAIFTARHPAASHYAAFKDFAIYRFAVARIHLVAGFGRIDWLSGDDYRAATSVNAKR